jgi:hypothetical protein
VEQTKKEGSGKLERVRKREINRKKKRLWEINIEFKGERYVSDMEQKYS